MHLNSKHSSWLPIFSDLFLSLLRVRICTFLSTTSVSLVIEALARPLWSIDWVELSWSGSIYLSCNICRWFTWVDSAQKHDRCDITQVQRHHNPESLSYANAVRYVHSLALMPYLFIPYGLAYKTSRHVVAGIFRVHGRTKSFDGVHLSLQMDLTALISRSDYLQDFQCTHLSISSHVNLLVARWYSQEWV